MIIKPLKRKALNDIYSFLQFNARAHTTETITPNKKIETYTINPNIPIYEYSVHINTRNGNIETIFRYDENGNLKRMYTYLKY